MAYNSSNINGPATSANSTPVVISSDQSVIPTSVPDLFVTGQATQTATVNNILTASVGTGATDLQGYKSAMVQIICPAGTYTTGQIIFEGSNDNTNFVTIPVYNQLILTGTPITAAIVLITTTFIGYSFPIIFRYLRCRISTAVSGASASVQAISCFKQTTWVNPITQIAQSTAGNLNAGATQVGTWTTQVGNTPNTTPILSNPLIPVGGTTGDTGAKLATFNGATQTNTLGKGISILFNIGTVTGTVPTLVAKIQGSLDAGTTFFDLPATVATGIIIATGTYGIMIYPGLPVLAPSATAGTTGTWNGVLPRTWRIVYTIGGTTPSFTITNVQVNYIL